MPTLRKIKMYYDPLGRLVKTVNPDKSEQRVMYGVPDDLAIPDTVIPTPWENYTYDANDLASITNPTNTTVPAADYFTPKSSLIDALGRTIQTTEHIDKTNPVPIDNIVMKYSYDVRGNLLTVTDPYNRYVFEHVYDLRTPQKDQQLPALKTVHIDKGESTVLFDALGKPIESFDAKGAHSLSAYDTLQRPTNSWACNKTGDAITLRNYLIYGDSAGLTNPENDNLKAQVYKSHDESGLVKTPLYDFKGNLLNKIRNVIDSAVLKTQMNSYNNFIIDWTGLPSILDATDFETTMNYDALNRITELELPEDLDTERKKIIPTYNRAGALEKVDLYSPVGPTTTNYVENIAYNAKGQRLLIAFGNNRMTRYAYDPVTFRLLRQRTEGYTKTSVSGVITYAYTAGSNKQDDGFNYDLIGNIVNIFTRVTDCGIGGNPDELDRAFTYDSIYRLLTADGRESDTQSGNSYLYTDAPIPSNPLPSNVRAYTRTYDYDKLGNIISVVQSGTNGFTRDYAYNTGKNTLNKIEDSTPVVIESYTYDSCGNTATTNLNRNYVWNHADQLLSYYNKVGTADPTVFTQYDYAGQDRVSKMVRTGTAGSPIYERTIYIDGVFEYVKLETGTTYEKNYIHIMDDKSRIAEVRINPGAAFPGDISDNITYIIEDQIGSSVVRLNTIGTVIDEEEYYPFGDSSLRTFTYKRYRYVGKERDAESGLYYYGARYYAAWTCRFISVDPLAQKYNQLTPYQNAGNNPINDKDIDGMQGEKTPEGSGNDGGVKTGDAKFDTTANAILNEAKVHGAKAEVLYGKDGKTPIGISITENGETNIADYSKEGGFVKREANNLSSSLEGPKSNEHIPTKEKPDGPPKQGPLPSEAQEERAQADNDVGRKDGGISAGEILAGGSAIAATTSEAPPVAVAVEAAVLAAATAKVIYDKATKIYVTYTLRNLVTGQVYSGRASGWGDPISIMYGRYRNHHMRAFGFSDPELDRFTQGPLGEDAIRGREQQLIDFYGGAKSEGGTSGNRIRGVNKYNLAGRYFHSMSNSFFGPLSPYTGF